VSVTVTVNGKAGPSVVATNGDTISAAVTKNAVVSVAASAAAAPGGTGPQGPTGPQATTITVGSVSTLSAGSSATVTSTSSNGGANLSLAFGIPRGADGAAGATGAAGPTPTITATVSTLSAGSSATVTATPSNGGANVALAFGIPRGADGSGGGASLSDATPSPLGTAAAGTASTASRSDHVHATPVISYANLTNVPSSFAPSTHTHALSSLTQSSATTGQVIAWNGTAWAAATPGSAGDVDGGDYVGVVASISVTQHPADVSISINQGSTGSASFTVAASASTGVAVAYQWQENAGSGWTTIDSATSTTLSLTGLTGSNDDTLYRCLVSAYGLPTVASNSASLNVTVILPATPVITISAQPQAAAIANTSSTASFSITASVSSGTLSYQWQKREAAGTTWANVTGATSSTLSLTGLGYVADNQDAYRCRLTATGAALVTSSAATLTITWATAPQITIIDGPSTVNWPAQSNLAFVQYGETILGGVTTTRQWQALSGSTWGSLYSVLAYSNVPFGDTGGSLALYVISRAVTVRCVVTSTNSYGTTTATTAAITVNRPVYA